MTMPAAHAVSADNAATRSRTHHWAAPTSDEYGGHRSGLEVLRLMLEGRIPEPSIGSTLGFRLVDATPGHVAFEGEPGEHLLNPMGAVHGGFLAALLDSALGGAVMAALPADRAYTTIQLGVNLVRRAPSSRRSSRSVGANWPASTRWCCCSRRRLRPAERSPPIRPRSMDGAEATTTSSACGPVAREAREARAPSTGLSMTSGDSGVRLATPLSGPDWCLVRELRAETSSTAQ